MNVTGLDFNQPMLELALKRRAALETSHRLTGTVEFIRGDAHKLPFSNDSFDVVTIGYGLRNLASWEKGLSEMLRVATPGGAVAQGASHLVIGRPITAAFDPVESLERIVREG